MRNTPLKKFAKESPMKGKISGPCKAAAKRKFKVWPSAYARVILVVIQVKRKNNGF